MSPDFDIIRENVVREIAIHVTQRCNLSCKGCYAKPKKDEFSDSLSVDDLRWIDETFNPEKTVLLGGEPLLYEHLEKALSIFRNITISTNGYFVHKYIDMLKENQINQLQISIEGSQKYNDYIRGEGSYERAIQAGKTAKENEVKCYFRVGYCAKNLKDIEWLLENVSDAMEIPLALLPRLDEPPLSIDQQTWLFDKIISAENGSIIGLPHFWQFLGKNGRCNAGSERLNVTYTKQITPCHLMWNYNLGKIGDPVSVINQARNTFIEANKKIPDGCRFCPNADVCKGGCLASPTHQGCPLKRNFTLGAYAYHHNLSDIGSLNEKVERLTALVKDAEVC